MRKLITHFKCNVSVIVHVRPVHIINTASEIIQTRLYLYVGYLSYLLFFFFFYTLVITTTTYALYLEFPIQIQSIKIVYKTRWSDLVGSPATIRTERSRCVNDFAGFYELTYRQYITTWKQLRRQQNVSWARHYVRCDWYHDKFVFCKQGCMDAWPRCKRVKN